MRENKTPRQVLAIGRDFRALAQWLGVTSSCSEDGLGLFPQAARPLAKVVWDAFRGFPFQMWLRVPLTILHLVASVELFPPSLAAVAAASTEIQVLLLAAVTCVEAAGRVGTDLLPEKRPHICHLVPSP